ncbi:MAG: SH3 domain-containing protein [Sulfurimonas sp.]|nr:SH3 domain-containing protein [Sulfurimonas sp.]
MKYVFIILSIVILVGCTVKEQIQVDVITPVKEIAVKTDENLTLEEVSVKVPKKVIQISDLINIPQDVTQYSQHISKNAVFDTTQEKYEKYYFRIWNIDNVPETLNSIKWPFSSFSFGESYGENFQLLEKSFFDYMLENANFDTYATVNKNAVTLNNIDIRTFPTIKPLLMDPTLAGEGFPFDYMQNSTISANKPIFVSHYSKDREWVYIFSSFASGWVKSDEIVIIDQAYSDLWQKAQQVSIVKEDVPIYDNNGNFLFKSKIGMMFALIQENTDTYTILTVSSYKHSKPLYTKSKISKDIAKKGILKFNEHNINKIVSEVSKTNYGWGGMYGQRDCSSMLRDMYAPFGIWLPRNSYQQSKVGKVVSLENLSDEEKIKLIKDEAVPFETFLYKKGHIVLYVGTYNDEIIVFHNTWGIKTKKDDVDGRVVIGKPIFSTLRLGKNQENYDEDSEILRNLKSMNTFTKHHKED